MKKLNVVKPGPRAPERLGPLEPQSEIAARVVERGSKFWSTLSHRLPTPAQREEKAERWREFPEGAETLEVKPGVSRRNFLGVLGSGAALAGLSTSTGCLRKPKEKIIPFGQRPEDLVPGKPVYYASAYAYGSTVEGVLVESHDGRPIKVEGNPKHPGSQGATSVFTQASVLDLYDPDRSRVPRQGGAFSDWEAAKDALTQTLSQKSGGQGLALVVPLVMSPTNRALIAALQNNSSMRLFLSDPWAPENQIAAAELVAGDNARYRYSLEDAGVVASFDADFLLGEGDATRLAREWSKRRRIIGPSDDMSRTYVFEPHLTTTGTMADHRVRLKGSHVGEALLALAKALLGADQGGLLQSAAGADLSVLPDGNVDEHTRKVVQALAQDLLAAVPNQQAEGAQGGGSEKRTGSAVLVGERQPVWVHAVGLMINYALRNHGRSVRWYRDPRTPKVERISALAEALSKKEVDTVICWGTNPAYDAPANLKMTELLKAANVIHMGWYLDETAALASWHLPMSHYLEAWGDLEANDGTVSICQPLIEPLHGTYAPVELLAFLASGKMKRAKDIVSGYWKSQLDARFSERAWRQWLHDGVVSGAPRDLSMPEPTGFGEVADLAAQRPPAVTGFEVNFHIDPKVGDGRYANNAWLQELPHPLSKLTWDNAAYLSPTTAANLGLGTGSDGNGKMVSVTVGEQSLTLPAFIAPGQADDTVSITLGYGRNVALAEAASVQEHEEVTTVAGDRGFNANLVRHSNSPWFSEGSMASAGGEYALAGTQDYDSLKPPVHASFDYPERPIVLEATIDEFEQDPNFVEKANLMRPDQLTHLWDAPKLVGKQQWGMAIDLNLCTGCNACVVACQAENNIPVVGKEQVLTGREMHWMRIDRYYRGDPSDPTAVVQPMLCQHCEAAPCETVCPVAATIHSPEGLNDMAYNRCIGTRYCSNNCPYKVRRFNFFNYNVKLRPGEYYVTRPDDDVVLETDDPAAWLLQMQQNPDVTVRFRGVMEKCTYCVQRINNAKIEAHVAGNDVVADGAILTACQQVCPTEAIVFGDIRDPDSGVAKAKRSPRDYSVLRDLNTHPRTTYLARIRNPHPDLV